MNVCNSYIIIIIIVTIMVHNLHAATCIENVHQCMYVSTLCRSRVLHFRYVLAVCTRKSSLMHPQAFLRGVGREGGREEREPMWTCLGFFGHEWLECLCIFSQINLWCTNGYFPYCYNCYREWCIVPCTDR